MMNEASQRQIVAAEPTASTWLSANAGSGKTRVLTDRVARLLLRGVEPQRILCLTYTKAAASEMQNRLFRRLGKWAMLEPDALTTQLRALGEPLSDDAALLARARRLFARAIETPGGLKIQTIHSFCSALLRRFPLEAGVAPDFAEADERSLRQLQLEVLDALAQGPDAVVLRDLAAVTNETALAAVLVQLGRYRDVFDASSPDIDAAALFDLPAGFTEDTLLADVFSGDEGNLADILVPVLRASGAGDNKLADALTAARNPSIPALISLEKVLLYGASAKAGPFTAKLGAMPTKPVRERLHPDVLDGLNALAERVEAARPQRQALAAASRAQALHRFARIWIPALESAKARRGWLDFDDLILRARRLLSDPAARNRQIEAGVRLKEMLGGNDTAPSRRIADKLLAIASGYATSKS